MTELTIIASLVGGGGVLCANCSCMLQSCVCVHMCCFVCQRIVFALMYNNYCTGMYYLRRMLKIGNGRHVHPLLSVSIRAISLVDCW